MFKIFIKRFFMWKKAQKIQKSFKNFLRDFNYAILAKFTIGYAFTRFWVILQRNVHLGILEQAIISEKCFMEPPAWYVVLMWNKISFQKLLPEWHFDNMPWPTLLVNCNMVSSNKFKKCFIILRHRTSMDHGLGWEWSLLRIVK